MDLEKYYKYLPFVMLFFLLLLWHLGFKLEGDDAYFCKLLTQQPLLSLDGNNLIVMYYLTWSSRTLVLFNGFFVLCLPDIVWRVLNCLSYVLIAFFIVKLSINSESKLSEQDELILNSIACILTCLFFMAFEGILSSAGWVVTTTNYVWPFCFALIHFYILREFIFKPNNYSNKILIILLGIIALLEAISPEQLLGVVLIGYIFILIYCIFNKIKIPKIFYGYWGIMMLNLAYILLCPGDYLRMDVAIQKYYPQFINLTFINKLDFGVNVFLNGCITQADIITIIFFAIFAIYCYRTFKKRHLSSLSFVPLVIAVLFWIFQFIGLTNIHDMLLLNKTTLYSMDFSLKLISVAINLIVVLSILISSYLIYKYENRKVGLELGLLFIMCIASATVSGFSPLGNSLGRTYLYSYLIMMLCSVLMITDLFSRVKSSSELEGIKRNNKTQNNVSADLNYSQNNIKPKIQQEVYSNFEQRDSDQNRPEIQNNIKPKIQQEDYLNFEQRDSDQNRPEIQNNIQQREETPEEMEERIRKEILDELELKLQSKYK